MKRALIALTGAALLLTPVGVAVAQPGTAEPSQACISALEDLDAATVALNAAVAADTAAGQPDAGEEGEDLGVALLAVVNLDLDDEIVDIDDLAGDALDDLLGDGDLDAAVVQVAIDARLDLAAAVQADEDAAATDAAALRVTFEGAVAAAQAACSGITVNVVVNNDGTADVSTPGCECGRDGRDTEDDDEDFSQLGGRAPTGGVATGG